MCPDSSERGRRVFEATPEALGLMTGFGGCRNHSFNKSFNVATGSSNAGGVRHLLATKVSQRPSMARRFAGRSSVGGDRRLYSYVLSINPILVRSP